jgi:hypothetical protein
MYLRTVQRRNRDGSVVRYVQLAHNFRHPQTGRPQAQVLWSFGREEEVDRAQLERLVRSIERFLSREQALQRQARRFRQEVCTLPSGGDLLGSLDSVHIPHPRVDLREQVRRIQPAEAALRHHEHLPDHRGGPV